MSPHASASSILRDSAGWVFLMSLVVAPWAYGGTTEGAVVAIDVLLATVLFLWAFELLVNRRVPSVPIGLAIPVSLVFVLGWCSTFNAAAVYDDELEMFAHLSGTVKMWMPSSVDHVISAAWMIRATLLLGIICFVADLSQQSKWLLRIWYTVAVTGLSVALLGLAQKATGARSAFWLDPAWETKTFFAAFYYHANAGAYLNMVFPAIVALTRRVLRKPGGPWPIMLWSGAAMISGVAIFSNTSRMSQALGGLLMLVLTVWLGTGAKHLLAKTNIATAAAVAAILCVAVYGVAQTGQLEEGARRWVNFAAKIRMEPRWASAKLAITTVGDAGAFGFGPGTFSAVFPEYTQTRAPEIHGGWTYLHQDYLQTIIEWGWLGSALWASIGCGGVVVAAVSLRRSAENKWQARQRHFTYAILLALGATAIHALVDFPFQIYAIQLYISTYLGVCWGSRQWDRRHSSPP